LTVPGSRQRRVWCAKSEKRPIAPSCENAIIIPEGNDAKGESRGLEDLFERPQISGQTRMPHLMERKSTRRVEKAGEAQAQNLVRTPHGSDHLTAHSRCN